MNIEKVVEELKEETERRLQMIPSYYDRRKMRGLIQRIKTLTDKKAREEERERIQDQLNEIIAPHGFNLEEATLLTRAFNKVFKNNNSYYGTFKEGNYNNS